MLLDFAGLEAGFNVTKVVAYALFGFWFVQMLEALSWVVLVAAVIPLVDVASVYRGPTKVVVEEEPVVFERIADLVLAAGRGGGRPPGPPDVIFFALFLAASALRPRTRATWIGMTAALSATLVATYVFDLSGLPALPAISLGFLVPNCDLLWRALGHADVRSRIPSRVRRRKLPPGPGRPPRRSLAVLPRPGLEILRGLPHLGRVERLTELPQLRDRLGVGRAAREVDSLRASAISAKLSATTR